MKRKPRAELSPVLEHRLRTTAPGRRTTARFAALATGLNESAKVEIWSPLVGFSWAGTERKIGFDTKIVEGLRYPHYDVAAVAQFLSEEERLECRETRHWLWFSQPAQSNISPGANANAFLLALWIARPTPTYIRVRFHHNDFGDHGATRVLERFTWIGEQVFESVEDEDLDVTARVLPNIRDCYRESIRLRNALVLTVRACTTRDWQVAFTCFTAAMTSLLRHSGRGALVDRLAHAYAHIVRPPSLKSLPSARDFVRLHGIGTKIFVGRGHELRDSEENLSNLNAMSNICRTTWAKVLESSRLRTALEASDVERSRLFSKRFPG